MSDSYDTSAFLETVMGEFNRMRARAFAGGGYEGVTHAGVLVVARDTGAMLLVQRAMDPTDDPEVQETWEMPGGGLDEGEDPWAGAVREFSEEVGTALPPGDVVNGWRGGDHGQYQGFVYAVDEQFSLDFFVPNKEVQAVVWAQPEEAKRLHLRPEVKRLPISLADVSGNEDGMADDTGRTPEQPTIEVPDDEVTEPMLSALHVLNGPIPIHGVLAPEDTESGDARGFNAGAMTARPLRLPFSWQKFSTEGHGQSVVVGSVDRLMRGPDGMIHWEGLLMPSEEGDEFCGLLAFFGKYGVSVDGDRGSVDGAKTEATGVLWFDAVRAAGLTAVAIPAFSEAYVALGPHPTMPAPDTDAEAAMTAAGNLVGTQDERLAFDRGPGWVTDPKATKRIHDYWTKPGQPGYAKIGWGKGGDYDRCVALVGEKIAANSPTKAGYIKQTCAQWHHDALGIWPATHAKLDRAGHGTVKPASLSDTVSGNDAAWEAVMTSSAALCYKTIPADKRKQLADEGKALPDGSFPIETVEDLKNAIQSIGRAKDPAAAKRHIRKRAAALGASDLIPDTWQVLTVAFTMTPLAQDDPILVKNGGEAYCAAGCGNEAQWSVTTDNPEWNALYCNEHAPEYEDQPIPDLFSDYQQAIESSEAIETDSDGWEAVLTSSAAPTRALPPVSYFDRHPDTGALVIEEPDANGFRRTYGYAGEWGVCHVGIDGRCVEVPEDDSGDFAEFHLGRTKVESADGARYINTGVITYKVDHRGRERILTETAEQQHYDNVANAWAAVRLGQDERGIWFSGVVLPTVPEEDLVLIEAAGQVSGEWKYGDLRALQAVNVPGFAVLRDEAGDVQTLVASTFGNTTDGCEPTPAERMAALASADAEVRFARLKQNWEA